MNLTKRQRTAYLPLFVAGLTSDDERLQLTCGEALHALGEEAIPALRLLVRRGLDSPVWLRGGNIIAKIAEGKPVFEAGLVMNALIECIYADEAVIQPLLEDALAVTGAGFGVFLADAIELRNQPEVCLRFLWAARTSLRDQHSDGVDGIPKPKRRLLRKLVGFAEQLVRDRRPKPKRRGLTSLPLDAYKAKGIRADVAG